MRRTIAIDFDGTIHKYSKGFFDGTIYDDPVDGAFEAIANFMQLGYKVVVFTAREDSSLPDVISWCFKWFNEYGIIPTEDNFSVTNKKPMAAVYIDDRAVRFQSWDQAQHDSFKAMVNEEFDKEEVHIESVHCWCNPIRIGRGAELQISHRKARTGAIL